MNYEVTLALNSLTGSHSFFDAMVFFYAEMLPWIVGLIFCLLILFSYKRTIRPFVFSSLVLTGAALVNALIKTVIDGKRPFQIYETIQPVFITIGFGAFPSSHAFFFAVLTTLSFFFLKRFAFFFLITTFVIGLARITAGVHFLFDILAGWALGFLLTYPSIRWYKNSIGKEA